MGREARAHAAAQTPEVVPFQFYVPIAKVDKEQRLVTGIVTQEILDKQGDIVDYETAKKFFTDDTLWPGNMREMHQPKAVGKKVAVECDDANQTITLTSRVSKGAPDTWEKVLDGTLSFYSIGGSGERIAEKTDGGGTAKRLFLKSLVETSYVDNGACPTAKFEILKTVDGQIVDAEPEESVDTPLADPIDKATAALDAAAAETANPTVKVDATGIRTLIATLARATDRHAQKAAIVAQAESAGLVAALPRAWQGETVEKSGPEAYDIDAALSAISVLEHLLANEYYDARYGQMPGEQPDPVKVAQVAMLKSAVDAVLRFLVSEHEEQFTPSSGDPTPIVIVSDDDAVEMFAKSLAVITKAGARHSKSDNEMIQKVHDLSGSLGAACKDMDASDAAKVLAFVRTSPVEQVLKDSGWQAPGAAVLDPQPSEAVQKLTTELEATKTQLTESQATVAKQAETVTALDDRLKVLEAQPLPGGPVTRAVTPVDKTVGGPVLPTTPSGDEPSAVLKAFDTLVAAATSEPSRMDLIAKKMTFMREHGLNAVDPVSGRPVGR